MVRSVNGMTFRCSAVSSPQGDALRMDAGPAQAAEDGVVGRDLDGRRVGTGLSVPALGGHAGGGDLDEVLGHTVAREDGRRARAGWL